MNTSKQFFKDSFISIFTIIFLTIVLIACLTSDSPKVQNVGLISTIVCVILRILIGLIKNANRFKIKIKDKKSTVEELYNEFELENKRTLVTINTKNDKILDNARKAFPNSKEHEYKDSYNMLLNEPTQKKLKEFLKKNDPERIFIHCFAIDRNQEKINAYCSLSIYIDKYLLIQYKKGFVTKEQKQSLKNKLIPKSK